MLVCKEFVCIGKRSWSFKISLAVYRINIIIRTVCQRQRQRSGGEVDRAQQNFSFEHLGSMVRIPLEVVFSYIIIFFLIVYYLIYDQLLTNAIPNINIGIPSLY